MGEINIDKESINKLYIAYGSNLNLSQMEKRCPTARVVGKTELSDYELVFKGSKENAVATIELSEGSTVPVLIWDIKDGDEKALDRYEGYPYLYGREEVKVSLDGKFISAMIYIMTQGHEYGSPSELYLKTIEEGYKDSGFDIGILHKAVEKNIEKVKYYEENRKETSGYITQREADQVDRLGMKWW